MICVRAPFVPGFSCMTTRPGALPPGGMSSQHAGLDKRVLHVTEAETTLPIVAMPRDGSIPHIPMFMVTKAAPNSFDHAGCNHLHSVANAATRLFGQKDYKHAPLHAF